MELMTTSSLSLIIRVDYESETLAMKTHRPLSRLPLQVTSEITFIFVLYITQRWLNTSLIKAGETSVLEPRFEGYHIKMRDWKPPYCEELAQDLRDLMHDIGHPAFCLNLRTQSSARNLLYRSGIANWYVVFQNLYLNLLTALSFLQVWKGWRTIRKSGRLFVLSVGILNTLRCFCEYETDRIRWRFNTNWTVPILKVREISLAIRLMFDPKRHRFLFLSQAL